MSNSKRIVREDPEPETTCGRVGRPLGQQTRKTIDTLVRTPNVWFRVEQRDFVNEASHGALSGRGSSTKKIAARRGIKLEYKTYRRNGVVKLFMRSVVEG